MFEVILFDLGKVVVELGESPLPKYWLKDESVMPFSDWMGSKIVHQFEKGEISPYVFITQLKTELRLEQSIEEITHAFTEWPIGMYPDMPKVLTFLREHYHLAVLSNTNELHFPRLIDEFNIAEYFDTIFVSHHMGMIKPDLSAFEHVLDVLQVTPEKVLFLDDNPNNIEVATTLGIVSVQVCGEEQVIRALMDRNLLESRWR